MLSQNEIDRLTGQGCHHPDFGVCSIVSIQQGLDLDAVIEDENGDEYHVNFSDLEIQEDDDE